MIGRGFRLATVAAVVAAASYVIHAEVTPQSQSAEIQLQLGNEYMAEGRYQDALDAFQRALAIVPPDQVRAARSGVIAAALRVAEFDLARTEAEKLVASAPTSPDAIALHGDALWTAGLFQQAEARYKDALAIQPDLARGHHGMARAYAAQSKLELAMEEAQTALSHSPRCCRV